MTQDLFRLAHVYTGKTYFILLQIQKYVYTVSGIEYVYMLIYNYINIWLYKNQN